MHLCTRFHHALRGFGLCGFERRRPRGLRRIHKLSILLERETGIEPATFSLGKWMSIENKEHRR